MTISSFRIPRRLSCGRLLLGVLLAGGSFRAALAEPAAPDRIPVLITVGFMPSLFVQSNRGDVEGAFRTLITSVGRTRGYATTVKMRLFTDPEQFRAAIDAREINFAIFDSLTFLSRPRWGDLTPVFMPATHGAVGRRMLLLVRRGSGIRTLGDLRDKSFVELQSADLSAAHTWLRSRLRAIGVASPDDFFRSLEYTGKPSAAVLRVFFGKCDACLADDIDFQLMTELNPQVGAQLQVLDTSAPLVGTVICASEANWSPRAFRPALLEALGELQLDPAGRQMLSLFKIDQLVPYEEARLTPVRELAASVAKVGPEARP